MKCRAVAALCIILYHGIASAIGDEGTIELDSEDSLSLSASLTLTESDSLTTSLPSITLSPTITTSPTKKATLPDEHSSFYCFPIPLPSSDILTCSVTPGSAKGSVEPDVNQFEVRLSVLDPDGVQTDIILNDMYKSMEQDRIIGHYQPKNKDQALSVSVFVCNHRNKKRECILRGQQIPSRSGFLDVIIPIKISTPDLSVFLTGNMSKWMSANLVNNFFSRLAQLANRRAYKVRVFPSQFQVINLAVEKNDRFFPGELVKMDFLVALLDPGTTQPILEAIDDALNFTRTEFGIVGNLMIAGVPFDRAIGEPLNHVVTESENNQNNGRGRGYPAFKVIELKKKIALSNVQLCMLAAIALTGIVAGALQRNRVILLDEKLDTCNSDSYCIEISPPHEVSCGECVVHEVASPELGMPTASSFQSALDSNTCTTMSSASSASYDQPSNFQRNPQNLADNLILSCEDGTELVINFSRKMVLAAGGQAKVYFGIIPSLGASIAVKEMFGCDDDENGDRFAEGKLEYELLNVMRHCEHVVHVFGCVTVNRRFFMVSEYIMHDLKRTIGYHSQGMEVSAVKRFLRQIVHAVSEIHSHGVVHRDLKPANILVTSSGTCKIADFGIALRLENIIEGTRVRSISGTCAFTPPEALQRHVSYATDIWAIGGCVLEMLTGLTPWTNELRALEHRDYNPDFAVLNFVRSTTSGPSKPDTLPADALDFMDHCFRVDHKQRPQAIELLEHPFLCSGK